MKTEVSVTDFTKNGECSGCGSCCSNYIPMTKKEFKVLKRWVKRNHFKPRRSIDLLDLTCPFLDVDNHKCSCYTVRPEACRSFLCCNAKNGDYALKNSGKNHFIVNLRGDLFQDPDTVPFSDFQLLMEYIKRSPNNKNNRNPHSSVDLRNILTSIQEKEKDNGV